MDDSTDAPLDEMYTNGLLCAVCETYPHTQHARFHDCMVCDSCAQGEPMPDDDVSHTRIVPLYSQSGTYREWDVTVAGVQHSIIDEDGTWTLMVYIPTCLEWVDVPGMDVDTFLRTHKLILAA